MVRIVCQSDICHEVDETMFNLTLPFQYVQSMIELSRTQDEEVGDGTTSVIVLGMMFAVIHSFLVILLLLMNMKIITCVQLLLYSYACHPRSINFAIAVNSVSGQTKHMASMSFFFVHQNCCTIVVNLVFGLLLFLCGQVH